MLGEKEEKSIRDDLAVRKAITFVAENAKVKKAAKKSTKKAEKAGEKEEEKAEKKTEKKSRKTVKKAEEAEGQKEE